MSDDRLVFLNLLASVADDIQTDSTFIKNTIDSLATNNPTYDQLMVTSLFFLTHEDVKKEDVSYYKQKVVKLMDVNLSEFILSSTSTRQTKKRLKKVSILYHYTDLYFTNVIEAYMALVPQFPVSIIVSFIKNIKIDKAMLTDVLSKTLDSTACKDMKTPSDEDLDDIVKDLKQEIDRLIHCFESNKSGSITDTIMTYIKGMKDDKIDPGVTKALTNYFQQLDIGKETRSMLSLSNN